MSTFSVDDTNPEERLQAMWQAHFSLWRYAMGDGCRHRVTNRPLHIEPRTDPPPALLPDSYRPTRPPAPLGVCHATTRQAYRRLDVMVHTGLDDYVIAGADYATHAYWFLFCQWLRISFAFRPTFQNSQDGWTNLKWVSLPALAGAPDDNVALRAWRRHYIANTPQTLDHWHVRFARPLPISDHAEYTIQLDAQRTVLVALQVQHEDWSTTQLFRHFTPFGMPIRPGMRDYEMLWLPELVAAQPATWEPPVPYWLDRLDLQTLMTTTFAGDRGGFELTCRRIARCLPTHPSPQALFRKAYYREVCSQISDGVEDLLDHEAPMDTTVKPQHLVKRETRLESFQNLWKLLPSPPRL